jgi:hypothetical protein
MQPTAWPTVREYKSGSRWPQEKLTREMSIAASLVLETLRGYVTPEVLRVIPQIQAILSYK